VLSELLSQGKSLSAIARDLDAQGERTVKGGRWTATVVSRLVSRLGLAVEVEAATA
jgi:DNA-binding NarL/FixJ family response regulator